MNTSDLSLFIRIAETGSITRAAHQLDITTAAASSALKRLEQQLGFQLFIRSTRQLRITPQGEQFMFHCRTALEALDTGRHSASRLQADIRGELRFSVASDLGRNIVIHWVDEMLDQYPDLSIDLQAGDNLSDFYLDQVDMALRYGKPQDSSMVAFHIADLQRITCASPEYLEKYGMPEHPDDLLQHNCLLYRLNGRLFSTWEYLSPTQQYKVRASSRRICNDTDIVRRWAVAGKGIAYRSEIDIAADLESGRLVRLLEDFQSPPAQLYLLCPDRKQVTPAVIAFREMLREKCAALISKA